MRSTRVLSITLPSPMLEAARKLAQQENRTMSELVREALRQYEQQSRWKEIAALGAGSARSADVRNEQEVVDAIHQFRSEKRKRKSTPRKPARKTA